MICGLVIKQINIALLHIFYIFLHLFLVVKYFSFSTSDRTAVSSVCEETFSSCCKYLTTKCICMSFEIFLNDVIFCCILIFLGL